MNRREFLHTALGGAGALAVTLPSAFAAASLAGEVGITTGSFVKHLTVEPREGKLRLLDLPKLMREELDLRVIDLMTATLASLEPDYLDQLRDAAGRAGCVLTNLKMNQPGLDMASPDAATRRRALDEYKRTMDAAARLGVRWVRPLPGTKRPGLELYAAAYRELIDYGASRGITLLIENFGWMRDDPKAIPAVIEKVGAGLRAQPDTGNWTDAARYDGLSKAFPLAASCDFKALALDPAGGHKAYDLKRCFQIGWDLGFRGPWCLEHAHTDLKQLIREMALLRDSLREWMRAAQTR
ncbi:MAG: TIM barrel protein [Verrucomicrobiota bacterium]|nr:TIM barrel protein [Verrucomicrobiota bacterium]